jgi:GT2 family glycosyltransferase
MRLSILIVNWRSKDHLRRCLETVNETCADLAPEVVVVDGGSFDGCDTMLAANFPSVIFVQSQENLGFGKTNNLGFERVTGDALLLLNPDTELRPGSVAQLLAELESRDDAGIIGPKLLNTDGTLQTTCVRALPTPLNQALESEYLRRLLPRSSLWGVARAFHAVEPLEVEAVSGACMLMWSRVFRQVGGFSPEFFMYGEDMDLCAKVRRLGLRIYHVPAAEVVHHGGASSSSQASQFSTIMMRVAGETYMRLNRGPAAAFRYRVLQMLSAGARLVIAIPAGAFLGGSRRIAAQQSARKWWYVLRWSLGAAVASSPAVVRQN